MQSLVVNTGTLTKNEMQVAESIIFDHYTEEELFLYAVLASRHENHDPIELPLFHHLDENYPESQWQQWQQNKFTPFDPVSKQTSAEVSNKGETLTVYKGAAQILLERANVSKNEAIIINQSIDLFASKGYRTLAVAIEKTEAELKLVGLIPLIDPEREDSAQVIQSMGNAGVEVKMITGDNVAIAKEIGHRLGLNKKVIRAKDLSGRSSNKLLDMSRALSRAIYHQLNPDASHSETEKFSDGVMYELEQLYDVNSLEEEFVHTHESELIDTLESVDVFAEVLPEDKYMIIDRLQRSGHIVGMTGDGVNDAPALKKADCGFAVSNATDAARAAADIILTSPGISVINHAIEQARITFERMKSYATFRVAETIRIILFMTLCIVIFDFYPITALMIILLALLNDIPILAIAYDNTKVSEKPVRWKMNTLLTMSTILGISGVISSFLLFFYLRQQGLDEELIQSLIFLKLIIAGHSTIYITRVENWFWKRPWPSPLLFFATFGTEILGTFIAVYGLFITPIGWEYAIYIWAYALVWFLINDVIKMVTHRFLNNGTLNS